jgi:hypothetical protein
MIGDDEALRSGAALYANESPDSGPLGEAALPGQGEVL